jgi:neutral ceramidase
MESKVLLLIAFAVVAGTILTVPAAAAVSAGVAKVNITPSLSEFPTVSLGGFGERQGKPATSVRDEIFARALVLSTGRRKVALVSTDLLMISPTMKDAVVKQVADIGFTDADVLLAATHDHSAPECLHPGGDVWPLAFGKFLPKYFDWTNARIAQAIRDANAHLEPAQVGFASEALPGYNRNRRETGGGLVDPAMTVMKVTAGARTIALLVNFTAHPTIIGPESFAISGEWPGAMSRDLEGRLGEGAIAPFFNGTQGDQTHSGDFGSGWERVDRYGKALAEKAWALAEQAQMSGDVRIRISDPAWKLPPYEVSPAFMESTGEEYKMTPEAAAGLASKLFPAEVHIQAIRVGDGVFMAVPGEAIVELGLEMKKNASALGAKYPMCIGLANNYVGYILSPEQYKLGGYESGTSFYGPQLGALLVSHMKEAAQPLFRQR